MRGAVHYFLSAVLAANWRTSRDPWAGESERKKSRGMARADRPVALSFFLSLSLSLSNANVHIYLPRTVRLESWSPPPLHGKDNVEFIYKVMDAALAHSVMHR